MSEEAFEKFTAKNSILQPQVDAYYDSARKEYLMRNASGRWLHHTTGNFKMWLRKLGHSVQCREGSSVSPAEEIMMMIQDTRDVRYAGPLAGRDAGFYDEGGVRFLVTDSPRVIQPAKGNWGTLRRFLEGLIGSDPDFGKCQLDVFFGWLKAAYLALKEKKRRPGQSLVLAGPVCCGKSLLQGIITELLGGRSAKPYRYMIGRTDFNSELFGAEHLMLEDEHSSTDIRTRMNFAARIKEITVNETHSCHAKNRDAVNMRPGWRLTISVNDQPESMLVLPPITEDIEDKVILLRCRAPLEPFPTKTLEEKHAYWATLMAELPAFLDFLLKWKLPVELEDARFGVRRFHHPELLSHLEDLAPETKLLELIDRELWAFDMIEPWAGTAGELETRLRGESSSVRFEAGRLFSWPNACAAYLGRLAGKYPERVKQERKSNARRWRISTPGKGE